MKRVLVVLLVALAALVVAPSAVPQQPPVMHFPCDLVLTGHDFGFGHVRGDVQNDQIPEVHTPGMHRGYSQCAP